MKTKTTVALWCALLATAAVPGQERSKLPDVDALARARLIEEQEGDLKTAEREYRTLLSGEAAESVRQEASLRLGKLLWRLDKKDEAKPLLERAKDGGGLLGAEAAAVLQGQDPGARAQDELRQRADALVRQTELLVADAVKGGPLEGAALQRYADAWHAIERELLWLGEPAAAAIADWLRRVRADNLLVPALRQGTVNVARETAVLRVLVGWLWRIGTPGAQQYFEDVAKDPEVLWRRLMVGPCQDAAVSMLPVAARFLRDPDPYGEVHRSVMALASRFDPADVQALVDDPLPQARAAAYEGLTLLWNHAADANRERLLEQVGPALRRALRDPDPRVSRSAWHLVKEFGRPPRAARRFLLEELAGWPAGLESSGVVRDLPWPLDDGELQLLVAAARAVGPHDDNPGDPRRTARTLIVDLVGQHEPTWTETGVPLLLEVLELGYGNDRLKRSGQWATRLLGLASPDQVVRLIRALPGIARAEDVLRLLPAELPANAFPALAEVVERWLAAPPTRGAMVWQTGGTQTRRGIQVRSFSVGPLAELLLAAIGRTGNPEAASWLRALCDQEPAMAGAAVHALVWLSVGGVGEEVLPAMRELMVWPGTVEQEVPVNMRDLLFAELARRGDPHAIPLYPRAYELGLSQSSHPNQKGQPSADGVGIQWLGMQPRGGGMLQRRKAWHAYRPEQLVAAWRTILTSDQLSAALRHVSQMEHAIPVEVLPPLGEALLAMPQPVEAQEIRDAWMRCLRFLARAATVEQCAEGQPLRVLFSRMLARRDMQAMVVTLASELQPTVAGRFEAEFHRALGILEEPHHMLGAMWKAGIEPTANEWIAMLRHDSQFVRTAAIQSLRAADDPELRREVEARLQDPSGEVRVRACSLLAGQLSPDAVPALLRALRDPVEQVRTAAAEALQRIRFYQDEQAYWRNAEQGITTSRQAALARLLVQAKAADGRTADQRLLAIRSLAALAAPEALPYLIEWTADPDAAVATAAREAVTRIHQQAGIK